MSTAGTAAAVSPARTVWQQAAALLELGKPRLSALVVVTTAAGYLLAGVAIEPGVFALTLGGTYLAALGANALNQWLEADRDACMRRTARRPLPSGRVGRAAALGFGLLAASLGPTALYVSANALAGSLAFAAVLVYVGLYTPLKLYTTLNTLAGAVVGAIPPLIGWAAATGGLDTGGWILAGILFVWQVPHFLALAWMYREDYARGGFRMLPMVDPNGRLTGQVAVIYALVLIPLTMMLPVHGLTGWFYGLGALVLGGLFLASAVCLAQVRTDAAARRLFVASIVYLPVLLGLMVVDRQGPQRSAVWYAAELSRGSVEHLGAGCAASGAGIGKTDGWVASACSGPFGASRNVHDVPTCAA